MVTRRQLAMPTAAKAVGALCFGLLGWCVAVIATPFFMDGVAPVPFLPATIIIGLYVGWSYVGSRVTGGYLAAVGHGLTAAVLMGAMALYVLAFTIMVGRAMRHQYDGVMDAIIDTFHLTLREAARFTDPTLIGTLVIGAVLCAMIAEYIARRYP